MGIKFSNNGHSTLAASITSSGTSITVASGHGSRFPSLAAGDYFYATLIDASNNLEIVKCTARSSDVLTVTRGAESTTARAYAIGDRIELRVTAAGLDEAAQIYDKDSTSTGYFDLPSGTTAQEPGNGTGRLRFDTDKGVVMYNDGTDWYKIAAQVAQLSSVSGTLFAGAASTLTLTGSGFLASNLVVNFTQSSDSIDADVTVTPTSDTSASVTVPSSVYSNVTAGNSVSIKVTNSDGMSSAAVGKAATALPSGGTVTTYSSYRVHTFTSSGSFVVPSGLSLTADILMVAGGGAGGGRGGTDGSGGGGAGGMIATSGVSLSAATYSVGIGAGGSGVGGATRGNNGSNTTFSGMTTCIGGGGGGSETSGDRHGRDGGSGGGSGGYGTTDRGGYGTSGQGNNGGACSAPGDGGGGGKGAAGANGPAGNGGAGGTNNYRTGSNQTYAGGGGASGDPRTSGGASGSGGSGGGGAGQPTNSSGPTAGSANTGGGGGGAAGSSYGGASTSANGGSGIVVVRYQL